jgi:hypothetical protein
MSKKSRRKERQAKRRRQRTNFQEVYTNQPEEMSNYQHKCIFCGATHNLQQHHVRQLRFNGPDTEDNKVWICPQDHKVLHWLMDQNLDWILHHKNINKHEVRPVPLISGSKQIIQPPIHSPLQTEKPSPVINIYGGQVTFNF